MAPTPREAPKGRSSNQEDSGSRNVELREPAARNNRNWGQLGGHPTNNQEVERSVNPFISVLSSGHFRGSALWRNPVLDQLDGSS